MMAGHSAKYQPPWPNKDVPRVKASPFQHRASKRSLAASLPKARTFASGHHTASASLAQTLSRARGSDYLPAGFHEAILLRDAPSPQRGKSPGRVHFGACPEAAQERLSGSRLGNGLWLQAYAAGVWTIPFEQPRRGRFSPFDPLGIGRTLLVMEGDVNIRVAPEVLFKLLSKLEKLFSGMIGIAWKGKIGDDLQSRF